MRLGIFGGTFNPPHIGHLIVIESVQDQLEFDSVLFIPSAQTPNKHDSSLAPARDRLEMTRLAVGDDYRVSDIEVSRPGVSYTVDTLADLASLYPGARLHLIIGADNFCEFQTWRSPGAILERAELVVMSRPGFVPPKNEFARRTKFVTVPQIGISGTDIRRRIKLKRSIRYLVPPKVEEYIRRHNLYRA